MHMPWSCNRFQSRFHLLHECTRKYEDPRLKGGSQKMVSFAPKWKSEELPVTLHQHPATILSDYKVHSRCRSRFGCKLLSIFGTGKYWLKKHHYGVYSIEMRQVGWFTYQKLQTCQINWKTSQAFYNLHLWKRTLLTNWSFSPILADQIALKVCRMMKAFYVSGQCKRYEGCRIVLCLYL